MEHISSISQQHAQHVHPHKAVLAAQVRAREAVNVAESLARLPSKYQVP